MVGAAGWLAWAAFCGWVVRPGLRGGDLPANAMFRLIRAYSRIMHRPSIAGAAVQLDRDPDGFGDRPLVIVANHTAGVDPLLIQSALPFEVRWVMAEDMRAEVLQWLWDLGRVIFVDRESGGGMGIREALRHLKAGGTIGVFPEGAIARPARRLLPFKDGVGLLIARTRALVRPVVIEGTPQVDPAWASLVRSSRARLRFLPVIDFFAEGRGAPEPAEIMSALRGAFERATGWPSSTHAPKFENGQWWYVATDGTYRSAAEVESRSG